MDQAFVLVLAGSAVYMLNTSITVSFVLRSGAL